MDTVFLVVKAVVYGRRHIQAGVIAAAGAVDVSGGLVDLVHLKEDHIQLFRIGLVKCETMVKQGLAHQFFRDSAIGFLIILF